MSVSFSTLVQRARPGSNHATTQALRDVIAKIPPTTMSALPNGVRVASEANPLSRLATVGVWLDAGTRHEDVAGAARVWLKCGLLGTSRQSAPALARALDELGSPLHADVGREHTRLYVRVPRAQTERAVGLLADVLRGADFPDADVQRARDDVRRAQLRFEESPDAVCLDNLHRCAFDSTRRGVGAPLLGTAPALARLRADDLRAFRGAALHGGRVVLVGAGDVDADALTRAAATHFGDLPASRGAPAEAEAARFVGGEYKLWNMRYKTVHIAWGFETCGAACADSLPLALACEIPGPFHRSQHELGQHAMHRVLKTFSSLDHSTPTNTHFNEKCIEIANPFLHQYKDTGLCGMYVVGRPAQAGIGDGGAMIEVFQYTMAEWCRICQKLLHNHELEQAKVNLKSQLLFNMDGSTNSAEDIGRQVLYYGRRIPLEEMYARIDDITPTNVQEVLQHYFYGRKPVYSYLGYCANLPGYDWTQHWTYKYWY